MLVVVAWVGVTYLLVWVVIMRYQKRKKRKEVDEGIRVVMGAMSKGEVSVGEDVDGVVR